MLEIFQCYFNKKILQEILHIFRLYDILCPIKEMASTLTSRAYLLPPYSLIPIREELNMNVNARQNVLSRIFPQYTTRELVLIAVLIAVTGVFQVAWAWFVFTAKALGPFADLFNAFGFNVCTFLVLYLIRKPGTATIVKTGAAVIELLMGSPVGWAVIYYGFVEGLGADIAYVMFKEKFTLSMIITGSLLAWIFAAPVDAYRDAVPLTMPALIAYFGPGGVSKVWNSLLVFWAILGVQKANIKPLTPDAKPVSV